MVPVAAASDSAAPAGARSVTENVSLCSPAVSSSIGTAIVATVVPARNVSVPLTAV